MTQPTQTNTGHRRSRKNDVRKLIQIRASSETKAALKRAAVLRGQKLSEFVLESALRRAEETILDQRVFLLDAEAHLEFLELLDSPATPSEELRARVRRKPIWED